MPSGGIFISYRRQETAWPARQLYEVLVARFGAASVFKDVDDIEPGEDFVEKITEAVASCDVLLALIGPQWLTMTDAEGHRRLDDPEDFVRLELSAALHRGVRVVPILVDGATMPKASELPDELMPIIRRQAFEINAVGFNTDRLLATIAAIVERPLTPNVATASASEPARSAEPVATRAGTEEPSPRPTPSPTRTEEPSQPLPPTKPPSKRTPLLIATGAVVVALAVGLVIWRPWLGASRATPQSSVSETNSASLTPTGSVEPSASGPATQAVAVLPNPPILAHRGGLEHHQLETMQAMEAAARQGFAIETDVRFTSDGVAVLVHDEAATKGLDCGGKDIRVSKTTWRTLKETCRSKPTSEDANSYPVPTLNATLEAIAAASPSAWVFLEIKTDPSDEQLQKLLLTPASYGLSTRVIWTSFDRDRLKRASQAIREYSCANPCLAPGERRMLFVSGKQVAAKALAGDKLWGVAVNQDVADTDYVASLQKAGLKVVLWNPNEAGQWESAAALSPDAVMTDYPEKYRDWLANR